MGTRVGFMPNLTKLNAINRVFDAMGQAGISTLAELDYNVDAGDIDRNLDTISATIQTNSGKGFWFNRETFHRLTPNEETGRVSIPNNALAVRVQRMNNKQEVSLAKRGRYLIDTKEHGFDLRTFAWQDGYVHATIIAFLEFDDLPQTAKDAVIATTRFWYINDKDVDQVKLQSLKIDVSAALTALHGEESTSMKRNAFDNRYLHHDLAQMGGFMNNN